jgi:PAS domain S-box-containing protein
VVKKTLRGGLKYLRLTRSKAWPFIVSGLMVLFSATALIQLDNNTQERYIQSSRDKVRTEITSTKSRIEAAINQRVSLIKGIVDYVSNHGDITSNAFNAIARLLHVDRVGLESIQLAKDNIITYVYPSQENEPLLGINLMDIPEQREAIQRAIDSLSTVVAGPYDIQKGKRAFMVRTPIFMSNLNGELEAGKYWGMATVLIERNYVLREAGLLDAESRFHYSIRGKDGLGRTGNIFWENVENISEKDPVTISVILPGGYWWVSAIPKGGWEKYAPNTFELRLFGVIVIITVGVLGWFLGSRPVILQAANIRLMEEIENRKSVEGQLRESEDRYRTIFETTGTATVIIEKDATICLSNKQFEILSGYAKNEIDNKMKFADFLSEEDMREIDLDRRDRRIDPKYTSSVFDFKFRDKSGKYLDVLINIDSIPGTYRSVASLLDISERMRAEEEMARLATAIEQAAESILITDPEGRIEYVNPAFEKISGFTRSEVIGENPRFLKSGKQDNEFYSDLWESIANGENWSGRFINKRKDGAFFEEEATIAPVRDKSDEIIYFVAVKRDVTKVAALEEQLRQAQKMEAIGQLAGGVAHDFNNILQAIIGHTQLALRDAKPDERIYHDLYNISQAAERAAILTRQLLAFSRRQVLKPRNIDLNRLITDLLKMLGRLLGEHIQIKIIPEPALGMVHADRGQIEQVLVNLNVNARDAMPEGGKITIETRNMSLDKQFCEEHPWAKKGEYVMLSVSDTGTGIPQEDIDRIFEPFFTTKEVGKGTGLGLATVYGIIKQHEGLLNLYSEENVGTVFNIYLPRVAEAVDIEEQETEPEPVMGDETILLAEDEDVVRELVVRILESSGYKVLTASDGDEAIKIFYDRADDIDLVLLDAIMPKMSGMAVYKKVKEINPEKPVIFSSGYSHDVLKAVLVPEEEFYLIQKPYVPNKLLNAIRETLDKNNSS